MSSIIQTITIAVCLLPHIFAVGFDGGSSCSPKASRRGRAQLLATIPCDLNEQSYCNLPGTLYPWHAVRRFVHENQGLMKRMYGDMKHISVLRTEIDSNEIELDDVEQAAARYSRSGWKKNKYLYTDFQNAKSNDVLTEPYFRPTTSSTTTTQTPSTTSRNPTQAMSAKNPTTVDASTPRPATSSVHDTNATVQKIATSINAVFEKITLPSLLSTEPHTKESVVRHSVSPRNKSESTAATISTTLRIFLPAKIPEASITPPQEDGRTDPNHLTSTESLNDVNSGEDGDSDEIRSELGESGNTFPEVEDVTLKQDIQIVNETTSKQANRNGVRPSAVFPAEPLESQLFQDAVHKEQAPVVPPPNARGVNACPVKEEVVAPFWANNTRGEVLALLNLYPFEQYVHWEKCTNEHKQMWCREGCRCEQQFRLHRLLAYDPHNECRGIFSDWFRFPSCCICKCYDIPLEYRVTSRSPRAMEPAPRHPADVAQDEVKKAVYDHASESWYHRSMGAEDKSDGGPRPGQPTRDELDLDMFD